MTCPAGHSVWQLVRVIAGWLALCLCLLWQAPAGAALVLAPTGGGQAVGALAQHWVDPSGDADLAAAQAAHAAAAADVSALQAAAGIAASLAAALAGLLCLRMPGSSKL